MRHRHRIETMFHVPDEGVDAQKTKEVKMGDKQTILNNRKEYHGKGGDPEIKTILYSLRRQVTTERKVKLSKTTLSPRETPTF